MPSESLPIPRPAEARPAPSTASRLALAEFLLRTDDVAVCGQRVLEWLAQQTGTRHGLVALIDVDGVELRGAVALGLSGGRASRLRIGLDDREHPLVKVLEGRVPVSFAEVRLGGPGLKAFARVPSLAIPLLAADEPDAIGVLLAAPVVSATDTDTRWAATLLGARLFGLRRLDRLQEIDRRLRRERGLLLSIVNAVPDPVTLTDGEGRIVIANARAELILASKEDDSEGRRRAVALNNMLFSSALWRRGFERDAEPSRHELPLVDPSDGSDMLFELLSAPAMDPAASGGIVSILRNVTDLRRATEEIEENYRKLRIAEADVRAERDRLDLIIDSVADPILVTDPSGNIVLMNAPAERLFTVPEPAGDEVLQRVRANDAHASSFVANLFLGGSGLTWRGELGLVDPATGGPIPVEAVAGKIISERGEVTAVVTILHDRTEEMEKARLYVELKRASEQLQQRVHEATAELVRHNELLRRQHIELEQASALKTQFLANMSHEFRTPLNAILGYTSMLLQGVAGELTAHQRRNLARVEANSRHLLAIINDILDIARIEAGKMPLHVTDFRLAELTGEVLTEVEPIIVRSRVPVLSDIGPGLPPLRSDRQKVKQILINLLTNALKFTREGSVKISIGWDRAADRITIAVADTGIGIAPEDQQRVFDDFRQADNSPTREYGGAGLGLAICRRLATMLSGEIALESTPGVGSTFTVALPRRPRRRP